MIDRTSLGLKFRTRDLSRLKISRHVLSALLHRPQAVIMPAETKENLFAKLAELGETMPKSSSVMQIKARISELKELNKGQNGPTLKEKLVELNRVARKKPTILEFAEAHQVSTCPSDTIAKIYARVEAKLTQETPGHSQDLVGFGKYPDKTYIQVFTENPDYVQWIIQTAEENGDSSHWRLRRLATWCARQQTVTKIYATATKSSLQPRASLAQDRGRSSHHLPEDFSDGSFQAVSASDQEVLRLQQELEQIKSEKAELEVRLGSSKQRREM